MWGASVCQVQLHLDTLHDQIFPSLSSDSTGIFQEHNTRIHCAQIVKEWLRRPHCLTCTGHRRVQISTPVRFFGMCYVRLHVLPSSMQNSEWKQTLWHCQSLLGTRMLQAIWGDFGACDCFCFAGQSMIADTTLSSFFFFRLLPLGVTSANHLPPSHPLPPNGSFLLSIISVTSLPLLVTVPTFKGVFVYMETQNPQQFKTRLLN